MDILAEELAQARARGAVFSVLRRVEPWGVAFNGVRPLTAHVLLEGSAWLEQDDEEPFRLQAGDGILVRAGNPYRISSRPGVRAEPIGEARTRGNDVAADRNASVLLCGAYVLEGSVADSLLHSLPRVVALPAADRDPAHAAAVQLLACEVQRQSPGQQTLLDRLLDLNLVYALRAWWSRAEAEAPGWYQALADPALAPVLNSIHAELDQPWTVDRMAHLARLSRAAFAARFADVVGVPPGRYLTALRMRHAQDLLARTNATLASVARAVGYGNEFAFATAFRKQVGVAPGLWRTRTRSER